MERDVHGEEEVQRLSKLVADVLPKTCNLALFRAERCPQQNNTDQRIKTKMGKR